MDKRKLTKYLLYGLFAYIMLALVWWAVLLVNKNEDLYLAQKELIEAIKADSDIAAITLKMNELESERKRQKYMILGEGAVFGISIIAGLWFIYRSYHKELELADQQRDFLLSVTHELNSPLASINLVIDTLQKRQLGKEREVQLYRTADMEVNRLNSLVNNLLFAAKVEGNYQYNFESVDLSQLIEDSIKKYKQKFPHIEFEKHVSSDILLLDCDRETMVSLLNNLIENAVKYGKDSVEIQGSQEGENFILSVSDNGKGIEKKDADKIFDKFYRLEKNRKDSSKGTGLGLFIVKKIVDAHRGTISIKSVENEGSSFEITLPNRQV